MRTFILIFLLTSVINAYSQSAIWDKWDASVIEKANTAKDFEYYSDEEKKVVFFMNLARLDGPLFAETILKEYIKSNNTPENSYVKSLFRDLRKVNNLPLLFPEEDLTSIAQGHAIKSGKTGHVGHRNFKNRFEAFMGNPYSNVGENCSYGYKDAVDIVLSLLIDDGVKGVGHRNNTLNPEFNSVGVAIREHRSYRYNCVIDFGKQDRSNLNDVPF